MVNHFDIESTLREHGKRIDNLEQSISVHDYVLTQVLFISVGITPDPARALAAFEESLMQRMETADLTADQKEAALDCAERIFSSARRTLKDTELTD